MVAICDYCGWDFDPSAGDHGCAESKMNPNLIARLSEDHGDTQECEHGFHAEKCPSRICLRRDLRMAVDRLVAYGMS